MRFRHSVRLLTDNFSGVFKLLLYRFITAVVFFSLSYVILRLGLANITGSAQVQALKSLVSSFFSALFSGDTEVLQAFRGDFRETVASVVSLIAANSGEVAGCIVGLALMYLLHRFVNGLAVFAMGGTVNDRLATYSRTRFSQAYFSRLGKAALYQLLYVPVCFVYDAAMLSACWLFFFYVPSFLPLWGFVTVIIAVCLTLTAVVCLEALKMTLISNWMPAVIADGAKVGKAFGQSLSARKDFGVRYASYLVGIYLIVIINVLCALATVGSALLLTLPMSYIFLLDLQFVHYYHATDRKYFVSLDRIAGKEGGPEDLGE